MTIRPGPEASVSPGPWVAVSHEPIDPAGLLARVGDAADGAVLLFLGTVRNHSEGRQVSGLRYEAYLPMAEKTLRELAHEMCLRLGTDRLAVIHRLGTLDVGEVSVGVAVSSPHRAEAFATAAALMDELKRRVPIWKHERYESGQVAWVEGAPIQEPGDPGGSR